MTRDVALDHFRCWWRMQALSVHFERRRTACTLDSAFTTDTNVAKSPKFRPLPSKGKRGKALVVATTGATRSYHIRSAEG
jgi:hypothetical protein